MGTRVRRKLLRAGEQIIEQAAAQEDYLMAGSDRFREPLPGLRSAVVFLIDLQAASAAGFLAHAVGGRWPPPRSPAQPLSAQLLDPPHPHPNSRVRGEQGSETGTPSSASGGEPDRWQHRSGSVPT